MKKLLRFMKGFGRQAVLSPVFKMFEAILELFVPLVVAGVIDRGINGGDGGYIVRMCLLLALLGVVGLSFSITAQYFAARTAAGFVREMRHSLFAHIESLSYSDIDKVGTSTLITRMTNDSNQVQSGINMTLRLLLRSPFVVFGAMIMAFTIDVPSALVFTVVIPVLSVVVFGIMLISMPLYKKVQHQLDGVLLRTRENLTGVRVIRAFCKEEDETVEFEQKTDELMALQNRVGRISALLNPVTLVIVNLAIVFLIYTGSLRINTGELTQGQLVAIYNYMSQILVELIKLANLIINITKSLACAKRIQAVFDIPAEENSGTEAFPAEGGDGYVEFRDVSMRYEGAGADSLYDLNLSVKRGETIGIIGGTGSGKTTLVNLIPGFYTPRRGKVLIAGRDIGQIDRADLRRNIGIVPQKAELFHGTVRENMKWADCDATDEEIEAALATAQADGVVRDKGGLDFVIEQNGRNLSGGQKQRLTIARALVGKPQILILDDSASALDFATDAALRRAITHTTGDTTLFIVSQRASSVMYADRIVVLDDGTPAGIGTHEELMRNCEVYREIYSSQFTQEVGK